MITTFREGQRRVQARIQNTSVSVTNENDLLPKIKDWFNERYNRIYMAFPWEGTIDNYTLTLTASQKEYVFDRNVYKVWKIFDQKNGRPIPQIDLASEINFNSINLDQTGNVQTGDPQRYYLTGKKTVKAAVASAEKVTVVSTSAMDITPACVRIIGLVNGVRIGENLTLTGTTPVVSANTYDTTQKLQVIVGTIDSSRKVIYGKVTVTGNTSATVYAQMSPQEFSHEYQWFRVSPTPTSDVSGQPTWLVWHSLPIEFLVDDNDTPIMDCMDALVEGVFADALRDDGLTEEADKAEVRFSNKFQELLSAQPQPDRLEQFVPYNKGNSVKILDYGRVVSGW